MEKCGRPPLPKSADPKVQARREADRVPDAEKKGKCGRKPLPPSDDPKVQAKREKARANAQKKREGVKQTKAVSTIAGAIKRKITTDDSKAKATAKAVSTIAGVIKRKLTPVSVKPAKKEDTNRLHNLPEDLQKKIMDMSKIDTSEGWTKGVMNFEDWWNTFYMFDGLKDFKKEFLNILDGNLDKYKIKSFKDIPPNTTIPYEWTDLKKAKDERVIKILKKTTKRLLKQQKTKEEIKDFEEKGLIFIIKYTNAPNTYWVKSETDRYNGDKYDNYRKLTYDYDDKITGTRTFISPTSLIYTMRLSNLK